MREYTEVNIFFKIPKHLAERSEERVLGKGVNATRMSSAAKLQKEYMGAI